jgi:hypothetical protein
MEKRGYRGSASSSVATVIAGGDVEVMRMARGADAARDAGDGVVSAVRINEQSSRSAPENVARRFTAS